jgi:metal-responsive CopG/Arc/MetJ family transcriptional regulator
MAVKTINISLDEKLLKEVDKAAKAEYSSRSDYIRSRLVKDLQQHGDNTATIKAAKRILKDYKQDFKNLADR